jgi:hypothetical protein
MEPALTKPHASASTPHLRRTLKARSASPGRLSREQQPLRALQVSLQLDTVLGHGLVFWRSSRVS